MDKTTESKIFKDIEAENTKSYRIKLWARKKKGGYHIYLMYSRKGKSQKSAFIFNQM